MKKRDRSGSKLVRLNLDVTDALEAENLRHGDGRKLSYNDIVKRLHETYRRWALKGILNIEMRTQISIVRDHLGESGAITLSQITSALERASKFKDPDQCEEFLEEMELASTGFARRALEIRIADEGILKQMGELPEDMALDVDLEVMSILKEGGKGT